MPRYTISDGQTTHDIEAASFCSAMEAAKALLRDGEWGEITETIWVHATITEEGDEHRMTLTLAIEPEAPPCVDDDSGHDWQSPHCIVGGSRENPGVRGHGGGVVIDEVCMRCGCRRRTDTWATDPVTGEQGLCQTSYAAGHYADKLRRENS